MVFLSFFQDIQLEDVCLFQAARAASLADASYSKALFREAKAREMVNGGIEWD